MAKVYTEEELNSFQPLGVQPLGVTTTRGQVLETRDKSSVKRV